MTIDTVRTTRGLFRDDGGFAMVAALLSIMVAGLLGAVVMQLSIHTTQGSAYDRARTQSVHAAEAGLDQVLAMFRSSGGVTLPCELSGTLTATPPATWSAVITYYPAYPLLDAPMTCTGGYLAGTVPPVGASVRSTGSVEGWSLGTVERHMEMQLKLEPVLGLFNKAIFSNSTPSLANSITIYGESGNDADVISNGDWSCQNGMMVYGSIYVQGTATMTNSCRTAVDLWANGDVSMSLSSRVDHDLKSSTGSVTMANQSSVGNNAVMGGTCTGCDNRVAGTVTTGNVQPPPPSFPYPAMVFDAAAWTADGWTIEYFTNCATARDWVTNPAHTNVRAVLRITGGCDIAFSQQTTVTRAANLAIFTDGAIATGNNTTFKSGNGDWHELLLIVESDASCDGGNGEINLSNRTSFETISFFLYSPCKSTFANHNTSGRGQLYGEFVGVTNNLTFTFHATFIPGAGEIVSYDVSTAFVREVD